MGRYRSGGRTMEDSDSDDIDPEDMEDILDGTRTRKRPTRQGKGPPRGGRYPGGMAGDGIPTDDVFGGLGHRSGPRRGPGRDPEGEFDRLYDEGPRARGGNGRRRRRRPDPRMDDYDSVGGLGMEEPVPRGYSGRQSGYKPGRTRAGPRKRRPYGYADCFDEAMAGPDLDSPYW